MGCHGEQYGCTLRNMVYRQEVFRGLRTGFVFVCTMCNLKYTLWSEPEKEDYMDVNTAAVASVMTIGGGFTSLQQMMTGMEIRCMSVKTYDHHHSTVSRAWEETAMIEMKAAAAEEATLARQREDVDNEGVPFITVVADGSWAKRSYRTNYNSLSGVMAMSGMPPAMPPAMTPGAFPPAPVAGPGPIVTAPAAGDKDSNEKSKRDKKKRAGRRNRRHRSSKYESESDSSSSEDECKCPSQQPATQIFITPPGMPAPPQTAGYSGCEAVTCAKWGGDQYQSSQDYTDPAQLCRLQCYKGKGYDEAQTQVICCPPVTCNGSQRKKRQEEPTRCCHCGADPNDRSVKQKRPQYGNVEGMMPASQQFLMFLQAYGLAAALIRDRNRREDERAEKEREERAKDSRGRSKSRSGTRKATIKKKQSEA